MYIKLNKKNLWSVDWDLTPNLVLIIFICYNFKAPIYDFYLRDTLPKYQPSVIRDNRYLGWKFLKQMQDLSMEFLYNCVSVGIKSKIITLAGLVKTTD